MSSCWILSALCWSCFASKQGVLSNVLKIINSVWCLCSTVNQMTKLKVKVYFYLIFSKYSKINDKIESKSLFLLYFFLSQLSKFRIPCIVYHMLFKYVACARSNVRQTDICIKSSETVDIVLFIGPLIWYIGLRCITFTIFCTHTHI